MYKIYGRSKITLNRHGAIASNFAANMRLFEATGMGACLLTESRPNLIDLFEPSTEVVTYDDLADLQTKLELVLRSESLRQGIAEAGQRRCVKQHSYSARIKEILGAFTN
jgi:spore maturation protein CgeB